MEANALAYSLNLVSLAAGNSGKDINFHTLSGLSVPISVLSSKYGPAQDLIQIVEIGPILQSVFRAAIGEFIIPPRIAEILLNPTAFPHLQVSTTRVPIFDGQKASPGFGYWRLGSLEQILSTSVLSVLIQSIDMQGRWTLPEIQICRSEWASQGIDLGFHFILILSEDAHPSNSLSHPRSLSVVSSASLDQNWAESASELFSSESHTFFPTAVDAWGIFPNANASTGSGGLFPDTQILRCQSTWLNDSTEEAVLSPIADQITTVFTADLRDIDFRNLLVPGMAIETILFTAGISSIEQESAQYQEGNGASGYSTVWQMYRNYKAMASILETLDLPIAPVPQRVYYPGGLSLSTIDMIRQFGWSASLCLVQTGTLGGGVPTAEKAHYRKWCGLVAMFGDGGFYEQLVGPCTCPPASKDELSAAELSQNWLLKELSSLKRLLVEKERTRTYDCPSWATTTRQPSQYSSAPTNPNTQEKGRQEDLRKLGCEQQLDDRFVDDWLGRKDVVAEEVVYDEAKEMQRVVEVSVFPEYE
ncbi:hypothetical protein C8F01DRAFT_1093451 [Mycena amicta]|nr:hypothetical protein C8F01DRAFT_1093451 [Mycena amicta]